LKPAHIPEGGAVPETYDLTLERMLEEIRQQAR
jgi:hypothetical protein